LAKGWRVETITKIAIVGCSNISDMAAIRENRSHRANAEMAFHVLDLMQSFEEASTSGQHIEIQSRCERPATL
jgi:hypothetical protein